MILLWLLMILAPIFIIVAIWTKLIEKIWTKVVLTWISVMCLLALISLWLTYGDLENAQADLKQSEADLERVINVMYDYSDCVEETVDNSDYEWFIDCWFDLYDIINK